NLSQNVVHSDSDLILHNSSVLIDKEPKKPSQSRKSAHCFLVSTRYSLNAAFINRLNFSMHGSLTLSYI
ncbi:hypothetical protein FIU43_06600, partial [Enterococcus faecium]